MGLNVFGLVSVDTLEFDNYTSYLGGGALSTAWVASLWGVQSTLYSVSYNSMYNEVFDRNLTQNNKFFSHIRLSENKLMTRFKISRDDSEFKYKILNLNLCHDELRHFLSTTTGLTYIKIPAVNFIDLATMLTAASLNPQGRFDLIEITKKIHTDGFIFLNYTELISSSKLNLPHSLKYIESLKQSFVITLGKEGVICYYSDKETWYFCPSVHTAQPISTLGCGDAFAGGFLAAYAKHHSLLDCLFYGTISAYLATYSVGNMVEVWLKNTNEENVFRDIKKQINQFSTANDLVTFLHYQNNKTIILPQLPNLARKFDWKLYNIF